MVTTKNNVVAYFFPNTLAARCRPVCLDCNLASYLGCHLLEQETAALGDVAALLLSSMLHPAQLQPCDDSCALPSLPNWVQDAKVSCNNNCNSFSCDASQRHSALAQVLLMIPSSAQPALGLPTVVQTVID
jgi:hypothetical protein